MISSIGGLTSFGLAVENGKVLTEEHNCYDDWVAHKKLRQKMMADPYIVKAIELDRQFGDF